MLANGERRFYGEQRSNGDFISNSQISTVLVNNLPPTAYWRWVWQIFKHQGTVVDVFIPKERNVRGRRFGFVRFSTRNDAYRTVKALNGAWLMDYRLNVLCSV
ncbi:hypothetical protein REPUB_Repub15cG0131300 [Reevesia pubescens]